MAARVPKDSPLKIKMARLLLPIGKEKLSGINL